MPPVPPPLALARVSDRPGASRGLLTASVPVPLLVRQLARFSVVGVLGTTAYVAVFLVLRARLGAQIGSGVARVLVAVPTTWVNSRFTFGSRIHGLRLHLAALVLLTVGLATTSCALLLLQTLVLSPPRAAEVLAVALANVLAAAARFLLLRSWATRAGLAARVPLR